MKKFIALLMAAFLFVAPMTAMADFYLLEADIIYADDYDTGTVLQDECGEIWIVDYIPDLNPGSHVWVIFADKYTEDFLDDDVVAVFYDNETVYIMDEENIDYPIDC